MVAYNPHKPQQAVLYPGFTEACDVQTDKLRMNTILISVLCLVMTAVIVGVILFQGYRRNQFKTRLERWGLP